MSTLTVVVPATDDPPTLERCLGAIRAADAAPEEVVVVRTPSDLSASGARNAGALRATGEVIVFVDADVEVHHDTFRRVREAFAADGALTAVFGSYDDTPAHPGVVSRFRNLLHHHVHQQGAGPAETFWTGLGAVRRSAFAAVGGFDEARYPHPSIEDIEFGDRLAASGATVVLDPSIQGTHLKAWSLQSMLWTDLARRAVPWVALQLRTGRLSATLNCGWRHRGSAVAVLVFSLAVAWWAPAVAAGALGALVGLNRAFYGLLVRQLGPWNAAVGVLLHVLHHLVAIIAVPIGIGVVAVAFASAARSDEPVPATSAAAE